MASKAVFIFSIFFICFWHSKSFAYTSFNYSYETAYAGITNTFDTKYAYSLAFELYRIKTRCVKSTFNGFGIVSDYQDSKNFRVGARYFFSPQRHPNFYNCIFKLGIEPNRIGYCFK